MKAAKNLIKYLYRALFRHYHKAKPIPKYNKCVNNLNIAVLGVYLNDKPNYVEHIITRLSNSTYFNVEQFWAHIGPGKPKKSISPYIRIIHSTYKPRMELLNRLAGMIDLDKFDYLIVTDDDIVLQKNFLDTFISLQTEFNLALAQPARTHNSWFDHPIVLQNKSTHARLTNFVEIGPLFSVSKCLLPHILPFDTTCSMGWGLDYIWPVIVKKLNLRMGIIDVTPVDHSLRRPRIDYEKDERFERLANSYSK